MALLAVLPAAGTIYIVDPGGGGDFTEIQPAINAAGWGDIVELVDDTFQGPGNETLDFLGKAITLRSQSGNPNACIIDCGQTSNSGLVFQTHEGPNTVVSGVTVKHGNMDA